MHGAVSPYKTHIFVGYKAVGKTHENVNDQPYSAMTNMERAPYI